MNDKIKSIVDDYIKLDNVCIDTLNQFAIEICQEQINECAKNDVVPMNYKNIAENE